MFHQTVFHGTTKGGGHYSRFFRHKAKPKPEELDADGKRIEKFWDPETSPATQPDPDGFTRYLCCLLPNKTAESFYDSLDTVSPRSRSSSNKTPKGVNNLGLGEGLIDNADAVEVAPETYGQYEE